MPTRCEKKQLAIKWTCEFKVSANASRKERKEVSDALGRIHVGTLPTSSRRKISELGAHFVTVEVGTAVLYDAAANWFRKLIGDVNVQWQCYAYKEPAPCAEPQPASRPTRRVRHKGVAAQTEQPQEAPMVRRAASLPSRLAGPAGGGWPLPLHALVPKCVFEVGRRGPTAEETYQLSSERPPLGEGTFSRVVAARHKATGAGVALKVYKYDDRLHHLAEAALLREVGAHKNVVPLLDVCRLEEGLALVFPLAEALDSSRLEARELEATAISWIGKQIFEGLAHIHERSILHGDLKPAHILVSAPAWFIFQHPLSGLGVSSGTDGAPPSASFHGSEGPAAVAKWMGCLYGGVVLQICDFGLATCVDLPSSAGRPA